MNDLDRLRAEYARRAANRTNVDRYSLFNQANLFTLQQRQRALTHLLRRHRLLPMAGKTVLEIGCGGGGVLLEMLGLGVKARDLQGVDLLPDRLAAARERLPGISLECADGRHLPFPSASFDLILQFTVFSSILDRAIQQEIAREMLRLLRPAGVIISYDFWLNPINPQTQGLRPTDLRALFPNCVLHFQRITLAPPLARRLVPISWTLAVLLEKLKILNTHYLTLIQPRLS